MAAPTGNPYWQVAEPFPGTGVFSDIRTVTMRKGRRKITDPLSAGTCTITGRRPDLQPSVVIGTRLQVVMSIPISSGVRTLGWEFRVADYKINYGTIAAEDTWELELEDALAYLGRVTLGTTTIASGTNTQVAANSIAAAANLTQYADGPATTTTTSGQTVTNENALDVYQILVNTEGARIGAAGIDIYWYSRNEWIYDSTVTTFTDTGAANTYKYTEYESRSLADNYADKVIVRPRGSSDVISGTGIFSYNLDSYSFDTQQAQNLADFMRGALDVDYKTPTRLAYLVNGQDAEIVNVTKNYAPTSVAVTFRGTTSVNQVIGYSYFATQEETRAELYLANSDFLNYMILDDTTYGKLDYNRLGW